VIQNALASPSLDIQEALKVLRFRLGRDVGFRPVKRAGMSYYSVDGKLRAELEILQRVGRVQHGQVSRRSRSLLIL